MRGWIFVGLITGVIFGGAAAMVAWIFAMPLDITLRVVALAIPLGIALEWVTVRGKGAGLPAAFFVIVGLAGLLFLQVRDLDTGPRFVRESPEPQVESATSGGGGAGAGGARPGGAGAAASGARVVEPGRAESEDRAGAPAIAQPASLAIRNPNDVTVRLWLVDSGGRSRLGRLRSGQTRTVTIRAREPTVLIEVRGGGGGYTMPVSVAPGASLTVDLPPPS